MNWACSLCGSRNWPNPDSHCPLCIGESDDDESYDDNDDEELDESYEPATPLAPTKTDQNI